VFVQSGIEKNLLLAKLAPEISGVGIGLKKLDGVANVGFGIGVW